MFWILLSYNDIPRPHRGHKTKHQNAENLWNPADFRGFSLSPTGVSTQNIEAAGWPKRVHCRQRRGLYPREGGYQHRKNGWCLWWLPCGNETSQATATHSTVTYINSAGHCAMTRQSQLSTNAASGICWQSADDKMQKMQAISAPIQYPLLMAVNSWTRRERIL